MRRVLLHLVVFCLALFSCGSVSAQELSVSLSPNASMGATLRDLSSRSGVVFVGDIVSITHKGGFVDVVFHVTQTLRGSLGSTYTMREWAGLWAAGQQRYRLGQRGVFFLHTPNAAGISSPVDGMDGFVPLIPMGAGVEPLLDARRLATRIQRAQGTPLASLDASAITLPDVTAILAATIQSTPIEPVLRPLPIGVRPSPVMPLDTSPKPLTGGTPAAR